MTPPPAARLAGLDLFRGAAVAGMILVNTPGSWSHLWWPLDHAEWHGFTPTDLVFPAFLFAVGAALALSFPRRITGGAWAKIARRTALLAAIGWGFQFLARPELENFRIPGVLQRIALCYALAAALAIVTGRRDAEGRTHLRTLTLSAAAFALLIGYWAAMLLVPVPGHGAGDLSPAGNLAGHIDRLILTTAHMWRGGTDAAGNIVYDPEGLLSTLPALANVLFGMLATLGLRSARPHPLARLAGNGLFLAMIALVVIAPSFPLNKKLWSSSFALYTSGLSMLLLAGFLLAARSTPARRALAPFHVLGMNAILGYMLSLLIGIAGFRVHIGGVTLQQHGFDALTVLVADPYLASFLYALLALALVLAILLPLHRRGIHLRL